MIDIHTVFLDATKRSYIWGKVLQVEVGQASSFVQVFERIEDFIKG